MAAYITVNDVWHIDSLELILRLGVSLFLGGLIGWEREYTNHSAGFRTHILVCLGSTLVMLLSIYGFSEFADEESVRMDPARLAAQVISGIGFLGAGTILRNGLSVSGLTTAASLWVVAAIGLSVGAGFYFASVIVTVMVIITLLVLNIVERKFMAYRKPKLIGVTVRDRPGVFAAIQQVLAEMDISTGKVALQEQQVSGFLRLSVSVKRVKRDMILILIEKLKDIDGCIDAGLIET